MKLIPALIGLAMFLAISLSVNAQDIIYTISGEINSQKTPLDSIAVENLTKQIPKGFGKLPARDDYRINLTRNEYWGSTSASDILNQRWPANYQKWDSPVVKSYLFTTTTLYLLNKKVKYCSSLNSVKQMNA